MERREFLTVAATAAIVTPTIASANSLSGEDPLHVDWRAAFELKADDEVLGIAFCHPGEALTEDDQAQLDGIVRWAPLEGPSVLAQKVYKLTVLLDLKNYLVTSKAYEVKMGLIMGTRAFKGLNALTLCGTTPQQIDGIIQVHTLLNQEILKEQSFTTLTLPEATIHLPKSEAALDLKGRIEGLILWKSRR